MPSDKQQYLKFCPKCGSTDITPAGTRNWLGYPFWDCPKCEYSGSPMEGTEEFILEYREKLKEQK